MHILFPVILVLFWMSSSFKMSETESLDESATLDYSYYGAIQTGVSMLDQTLMTLDFDPDAE